MNKTFMYIILGVVLMAAVIIVYQGRGKPARSLDERVTLNRTDRIPYGTYFSYEALEPFFPYANIQTNFRRPTEWYAGSGTGEKEVMIVISPQFLPNEQEWESLMSFVEEGNDLFVSARQVSFTALRALNCKTASFEFEFSPQPVWDTLRIQMERPPFPSPAWYEYPGKRFEAYFSSYDTSRVQVLGRGRAGQVNFIRMKRGKGNMFLHLAPLAFSNYFLLHKENISYYENVFSLLDPETEYITWDEYYRRKRVESPNEMNNGKNLLRVLFRYPSLKWGVLTALLLLVLFTLLEMRRKQRPIPVLTEARNESLDFARTIGRLYYQKRDHKNLARKMASYFFDYVRGHYKITGRVEGEEFIRLLHERSSYPAEKIRDIYVFIRALDTKRTLDDGELAGFHRQLELFYQNT